MLPATGAADWTVKVAGPLVTEPAEFVTITVNTAPESLVEVAGVVNVLEVAPGMATPFSNH
jgi:hypothetical protein